MFQCIDSVGRVEAIGENGDLHVRYGPKKWVFHPGAVTKVGKNSQQYYVRIINFPFIVVSTSFVPFP